MDFNSKSYQITKVKKYFKKNDLFLVLQSAKLNLSEWNTIEQNLKKLRLNYYKPLNKVTVKTLNTSSFKNFTPNIAGFILFINLNPNTLFLSLSQLMKNLKPSFTLISVKFNSKIYSPVQLKGLNELSYNQTIFKLHKVLDGHLKKTHVLTLKKKASK